MASWKNFKNAMKEKRAGKRKAPSHDILQKEEIVIQRLSPEVSGKAQKYSRIGAREFVPFEYEEVTLHHIKNACKRHFAPVVGERMVCDVLAGEQGPSCTSLEQIPDLKVVHVRFIEPNSAIKGWLDHAMSARSNLNNSILSVDFSLTTLPSFIISSTERLFGKALLGLWALVAGSD